MIKPEEIKIISSLAEESSFYFVRNNVLFLFECTEESLYWFKTFFNSFKDLRGAVVTSTLYNATLKDNTYLQTLKSFFLQQFGPNFDIRFNLATEIKNRKPVVKKVYPLTKTNKITLELIRDIEKERMDVKIYENQNHKESIYYSGMNYGKNISDKLDRKVMEVGYLAKNNYHSIINLYNKYHFYNLYDLEPVVLWTICNKLLNTPTGSTIIGLPSKAAIRYFDKRVKESGISSFCGAGPEKQRFERIEMLDTSVKDLD